MSQATVERPSSAPEHSRPGKSGGGWPKWIFLLLVLAVVAVILMLAAANPVPEQPQPSAGGAFGGPTPTPTSRPGWSKNNTSDIPNQGTVTKIDGAPAVDAGKQGKHVSGHPNCDAAKSQWARGIDHVWETQNAWLNGVDIAVNQAIRTYNTDKAVGSQGET